MPSAITRLSSRGLPDMLLRPSGLRPDVPMACLDKQAVITTNWRGFMTVRSRRRMAGCDVGAAASGTIPFQEAAMLSQQQIEFFHANGYLVVENAVSAEQLDALRTDFGGWVEESRQHQDLSLIHI